MVKNNRTNEDDLREAVKENARKRSVGSLLQCTGLKKEKDPLNENKGALCVAGAGLDPATSRL